jgi:hypothetical protein
MPRKLNKAWKPLVADARYEISTLGNVRRTDTRRIRKPSINRFGYHLLIISKPQGPHVGVYIHREVVRAFVGVIGRGLHVCHLDGNRANNSLENLRIGTAEENAKMKTLHGTQTRGESHGASKLKESHVRQIRELAAQGHSQVSLSQRFGVTFQQVSKITTRQNWKHVH